MALSKLFQSRRNELVIPESTRKHPNAREILRVWVANGGLHVSLSAAAWEDPVAWGVVLADLAKHVAKSYHLHKQVDEDEVLNRIKTVMEAELSSTTQPAGKLLS
jgi:hypothetical protein